MATKNKKSVEERIGEATLKGYSFRYFKKADFPTGCHSVWVSLPEEDDQWFAQKVEGSKRDYVSVLLDSLGL